MNADEINELAARMNEALRWGAEDWCTGRPLSACPYDADDELAGCWRAAWLDRKARSTFTERWFGRPLVKFVLALHPKT